MSEIDSRIYYQKWADPGLIYFDKTPVTIETQDIYIFNFNAVLR